MKTLTIKAGEPTVTDYAITVGRALERILHAKNVNCEYNERCYDGIRIRNYRCGIDHESTIKAVNSVIDMDKSCCRNSIMEDAVIVSIDNIVLVEPLEITV